MSVSALNHFYLTLPEPQQSCFMALRDFILQQNAHITPEWKYRLPSFYYKGKMLCYLWQHKTHQMPYVGFILGHVLTHPNLLQEERKQGKILLVDPTKDLPVKLLARCIEQVIEGLEQKHHKKG
jgi:hypothetical protein